MNRGRRGRRRGGRRVATAQHYFTGSVQRNLPIEPPQFNTTPMYPLTIELREPYQSTPTAYNLTPSIIAAQVRGQFGTTGGNLVFKVKSCQIYGIADASSVAPAVNADFTNLTPQLDDNATPTAPIGVYYGIAAKLKDVGTLNRPAKIGFVWSQQDQNRIISENSTFEIVNWAFAGIATGIFRLHIMFGYAGTAVPQGD